MNNKTKIDLYSIMCREAYKHLFVFGQGKRLNTGLTLKERGMFNYQDPDHWPIYNKQQLLSMLSSLPEHLLLSLIMLYQYGMAWDGETFIKKTK